MSSSRISESPARGGDVDAAVAASFRCPTCAAELLQIDAQQLACPLCARMYPRLGDVWCMVPEPGLWRALWMSRLEDYAKRTRHQLEQLTAAELQSAPSQTTSRRIRRVHSALEVQLASISEHLGLLGDGERRASLPYPYTSGPVPVLKCYENLFRDWSWGGAEAEHGLQLVQRLAAGELGRLAVYGAGAARLAVDVHARLKPSSTVALDLNPYPLLAAARLIRGETLTLPEFPVGPHSEEAVVVTQELRCPTRLGPGFALAFADVLCPPFAAESMDTVLTSWVIDAVDADFQETARAIGHVSRRGGTWLNVGPLRFDRAWSEAYSIEEVHDIVRGAGFEIQVSFRDDIDYFKSPHSGSSRRETVFSFAARKVAAVPRLRTTGVYPRWLSDPDAPIPLTPSTLSLRRSSVFTNGVLSLVDGQRSLRQISARLGAGWQMHEDALIDPLRAFFARFPIE